MAEVYQDTQVTNEPEFPEEDDSLLSFLSANLVKIIIGLIIVVLIVGGIIFFVSSRTKKTTVVKNSSITPTQTTSALSNTTTQTQSQPQTQSQTQSNGQLKTYSDNTFHYSIKIPQNYEAFKRAGNDLAYQIAVHPTGSGDIPITINTQPNQSKLSTNDIVNMQYGTNYPRETKTINGKTAVMVQNQQSRYTSYFFSNNTAIYELSVSTAKPEYTPVFNQILSSFTF